MFQRNPESLIIYERPQLRSPYLVAGFAGWPNAAQIATGVVDYLKNKLRAKKLAEIIPEDFYDFSTLRPITVIEGGLIKWLELPANEFFYWSGETAHDIILLLGVEPHLKWAEFADLILQVVQEFGVIRVFALGGLYDQTPHTREPQVSGLVNSLDLKEELESYDLRFTHYQGPSSFHTTLLTACRQRGIDAISFWGHAPIYVRVAENPKACYAVLKRLTKALKVDIDLEDLREAGKKLDEAMNRLLGQNPQLRLYVERLEQDYEALGGRPMEPTEETDQIIQDVEEFLKRWQRRGDIDTTGDID